MSEYYKCVECGTVYTIPTPSFVCNKFGCPGKGLTGLLIPISENEAFAYLENKSNSKAPELTLPNEGAVKIVKAESSASNETKSSPAAKKNSNTTIIVIAAGIIALICLFFFAKSILAPSNDLPENIKTYHDNTGDISPSTANDTSVINIKSILGKWEGTMGEGIIRFQFIDYNSTTGVISGNDSLLPKNNNWETRPITATAEFEGDKIKSISVSEPGDQEWDGNYKLNITFNNGVLTAEGLGSVPGKNFYKKVQVHRINNG